ncbi:hypothetical protein [Lewinella cohaerens]|uniref:hypothetical protein n=1 Tax=Lewinella cohaerens TaxID=70995 RepID=UPI00036D9D6B|nr:hypothetical protein [Lewinella cohaerens]
MKNLLLVMLLMFSLTLGYGQIKAVTENGDEVTLYDDGTWAYDDMEMMEAEEIMMNPETFTKGERASFLLKSSKNDFGFYLNPKDWTFMKDGSNPAAEYELHLKSGDLYGMIISEQLEIPLETLRGIALSTAKAAAPDLKIVKEEYRMVNGLKVLHLQMDGTMQGIKFSYYGYYYSNESGTVQYVTFTAQNLMDSYREQCDALLNGLVVIEK